MLRPLDALQVDAFLDHLPQRTERQRERKRDRQVIECYLLRTLVNIRGLVKSLERSLMGQNTQGVRQS